MRIMRLGTWTTKARVRDDFFLHRRLQESTNIKRWNEWMKGDFFMWLHNTALHHFIIIIIVVAGAQTIGNWAFYGRMALSL